MTFYTTQSLCTVLNVLNIANAWLDWPLYSLLTWSISKNILVWPQGWSLEGIKSTVSGCLFKISRWFAWHQKLTRLKVNGSKIKISIFGKSWPLSLKLYHWGYTRIYLVYISSTVYGLSRLLLYITRVYNRLINYWVKNFLKRILSLAQSVFWWHEYFKDE